MAMKGLLRRAVERVSRKPAGAPVESPHDQGDATVAFADAFAHHQAGRLVEAMAGYRAIVALHDGNFDAWHMLGVAAFQTGDSTAAQQYLKRALQIDAANANALANLGSVLRGSSAGEAEAAFVAAAHAAPGWSLPHRNIGSLRLETGDVAGAIAAFRRAIEADATDVDATLALAGAVLGTGEVDEAVSLLRALIESRPEIAAAHFYLGNALGIRGDEAGAESSYRQAVALQPDLGEASNNLGMLLQRRGNLAEAAAAYHAAVAARPRFVPARANLAATLREAGKLDEAHATCLQALEIEPSSPEARNALALILSARGDRVAAMACLRELIASRAPNAAIAHINLAVLLREEGDAASAEQSLRSALALAPDSATAKYNLATLKLIQGELSEGLRLYESRFAAFVHEMRDSAGLHGRLPDAKRWDGAALKGERLLVWTEQGLGDAVMMMRYLPRLRGCGAGSIVVQCQPPLARCIEAMDVADEVRIAAEPPPPDAYDRHVPIMSLALLAGEAGRVIPNLPYLTVPRDDAERWSARLGARERPRVGLAWAGSRALRDDARRSVPLDAFASLLNLKEIAWFSLQKDEGSDQCAAFGDLIRDWMPFSVDLLDTAALIHNLDLVISVDTVVAHVAGAIGKPVWMLNRFGSEWRWGLAGESTPWYPSMRILRQPRAGDWSTVIGEVHASLQALAGAGR